MIEETDFLKLVGDNGRGAQPSAADVCPECGEWERLQGFSDGSHYWHVCHKCRIKWWVGANLSAKNDEGDFLLEYNRRLLNKYREVESLAK